MTVSIPVFVRNPDGTAWEGRIAYDWSSVRESKLSLYFGETPMPSIEDIYVLYGVCPLLRISQNQLSNMGNLNIVYSFLYGHSLEKMMETQEKETYSMPGKYIYEPQEWTSEMVASMNWDLFCLAYYTFLCSKNDFESKAWEVLGFILNTLKNSPNILPSLLSKAGRPSDTASCSDFWKTVCDGLQSRTLDYLHENTCYTAFHTMTAVRSLFSIERYKDLEDECLEFLDEIAKERIDEACRKTYTVRELINLNIDLLFFYKDYFASSTTTSKTRQYVTNAVFTLLHTKGDKIASAGEMLGADAVYETALKYAQTDADRNLISNKRNKIAASVSVAKAEQEKVQREQEKKREKERRKDNATDIIVRILAIVFLISVATTVLFGLLTLLGVFGTFSKTVLIVSLCVMVPFLIIIAVAAIQDKK